MAAEQCQVFECKECGNIIEVMRGGAGELVCCGQPMELLEAKTAAQEGKEKHVPVVERNGNTVTVKVGSVPHPMEEKHHIEWIELCAGDKAYGKFLKPGDKPEVTFTVDGDVCCVREHCNIHGLWKA